MTEDEIVGWHHQLNGHEFEQTPEQCRIGKAMGLQGFGHALVTEQQQSVYEALSERLET